MGKQLWDVIVQIVVVIHEHNFKDYFEHVKCHQDKDTKYEDLQLLAELNVDVNILAVAFCTHNMKCTKQTIHLPINPVQLHTDETIINNHHFKTEHGYDTKGHFLRHIKHGVTKI